jgi:acetolactate synthase-1/2/3 large subunit
MAADPACAEGGGDMLLERETAVILAEFVGREPEGFHALVELAETLGAPVYDVNSRLNFPSRHPLNLSMVKDIFADADLVLCLDTRDWERATTRLVSATREVASIVPAGSKWIDIGFGDLELSSWAMDYQRLAHADLRILADTTLAIPALTELLKPKVNKARSPKRARAATALGQKARSRWEAEAKEDWDASPIALPRLATEVWQRSRTKTGS